MAAITPDDAQAPARTYPLPQWLRLAAGVDVAVMAVFAFVVAAIATSRASAHALTPLALAVLVASMTALNALYGWVNGMAVGALERLRGTCVPACAGDECPHAPSADPFERPALWRTGLLMGGAAAAWAAAGGGLIAVALNGRHANLGVTFVALAGMVALSAVTVSATARHKGAHAVAVARTAEPMPLRRRAWRDVAVPVALTQVAANVGASILLFHDYTPGRDPGFHVLTKSVALADVGVIVIAVAVVFNLIVGPWGTAEALLGRVDGAEVSGAGAASSALGVQGLVWLALLGLVLGKVASLVLPAAPTLAEVAAVRGVYVGALVFAAAGLAYVRGALNAPFTGGAK